MTAREAMAYGRPVVATRVGGLADLERRRVVLVEPGDAASLGDAIRALLDDPARRASLGEEGRHEARASFGQESAARALLAAYEAALSV